MLHGAAASEMAAHLRDVRFSRHGTVSPRAWVCAMLSSLSLPHALSPSLSLSLLPLTSDTPLIDRAADKCTSLYHHPRSLSTRSLSSLSCDYLTTPTTTTHNTHICTSFLPHHSLTSPHPRILTVNQTINPPIQSKAKQSKACAAAGPPCANILPLPTHLPTCLPTIRILPAH